MSIRNSEWTSPSGDQRSAWQADYFDHAGKRRKAFSVTRSRFTAPLKILTGVEAAGAPDFPLPDKGERPVASP